MIGHFRIYFIMSGPMKKTYKYTKEALLPPPFTKTAKDKQSAMQKEI